MNPEFWSWMKHDTFDKHTMPIVPILSYWQKEGIVRLLVTFCYCLDLDTRLLFSIIDT